MSKINVSIIVPVYNVAPYIWICLESVAAQTYTGTMECLIVDDCGTDESIFIAEKFISEYAGPISFRIIHRENNGGLSAARNSGILNAKGDYLYFLDSDDWITPDCIKALTDCLQKYPEAEIVQAGAICTKEKDQKWLGIEHKELPPYIEGNTALKEMLLKRSIIPMTAWNKLVRKSFITDYNLYFHEGLIHEDEMWSWFIAKHISRLAICNKNTYNYTIRDGSIMNSQSKKKSLCALCEIINTCIDSADNNLRKQQIDYIYRFLREIKSGCKQHNLMDDYNKLLKKFMHMLNIKETVAVFFFEHFPNLARRRIVNRLLNHLLYR